MSQLVAADFATANLRKLWELETRKGRDLLSLAPALKPLYKKLQNARKLKDEVLLAKLRDEWEIQLEVFLFQLSERLRALTVDPAFSWGLQRGPIVGKKQCFVLPKSAEIFFLERVIATRIRNRSAGSVADRSVAVQQVMRSLTDPLPKSVLRTDLRAYFESIPHGQLKLAIAQSKLLDPTFSKLLNLFLEEFSSLSGLETGVPRGTALGSELAEFYLEDVDEWLRKSGEHLLHIRYVDDILVVSGERQTKISKGQEVQRELEEKLAAKGLEVNPTKTSLTRISRGRWRGAIEYLGYELVSGQSGPTIRISYKRLERIRHRLRRTFEVRARTKEDGLLLYRVKLLSGNTRLHYNKRQAMIGVFFSNKEITNLDQLRGLDKYYSHLITKSGVSPRVETVLRGMSFVEGFESRRFHKFSTAKLHEMKAAWGE